MAATPEFQRSSGRFATANENQTARNTGYIKKAGISENRNQFI